MTLTPHFINPPLWRGGSSREQLHRERSAADHREEAECSKLERPHGLPSWLSCSLLSSHIRVRATLMKTNGNAGPGANSDADRCDLAAGIRRWPLWRAGRIESRVIRYLPARLCNWPRDPAMIYRDSRHPFRRDRSVPARVGWRGDLRRNAAGNARSHPQSSCISPHPPPPRRTWRATVWPVTIRAIRARREKSARCDLVPSPLCCTPAHLSKGIADVTFRNHSQRTSGSSRRVVSFLFDVTSIARIPHTGVWYLRKKISAPCALQRVNLAAGIEQRIRIPPGIPGARRREWKPENLPSEEITYREVMRIDWRATEKDREGRSVQPLKIP